MYTSHSRTKTAWGDPRGGKTRSAVHPKGRRPRSLSLAGPGFAAPHIIGLALFTLIPIGVSLYMSFTDWPVFGEKSWVGIDNYVRLFSDPIFGTVALNTLVFVVTFVPLSMVLSLSLAAWLSPRIKGRQVFRVLFFIPTVTPMVANVVVWRMIYQPGGVIDATLESTLGINAPNFLVEPDWAMAAIVAMSVWQGFGYNMIIFSSALDSVPESLVEAAELDGASAWQVFWSIKFPMISPSIFFATLMTLIGAFQVFTQPFILTKGGPGSSTATLVQYIYNKGFQFYELGFASAAAWVLFAIILGITAVQFASQKKWVHYE